MHQAYHPPNLLGAPKPPTTVVISLHRCASTTRSTHVEAAAMGDPRESSSYSVVPHLKYNTVGGVNGPLVILEDVNISS